VQLLTARELTVRKAKDLIGFFENDDPVETLYRCARSGARRLRRWKIRRTCLFSAKDSAPGRGEVRACV
jgi:hypothetical protein